MKKTLVRFLGGAVMVCGGLLGLPTSAHAQSLPPALDITVTPLTGPAHQATAQMITITHTGGGPATNMTVTFTVPKGAKVDSACQLDRFHGVSSYSCFVGDLTTGAIFVPLTLSMSKSGEISVEVTCDQGSFTISLPVMIF
jgi:hypothetical protein